MLKNPIRTFVAIFLAVCLVNSQVTYAFPDPLHGTSIILFQSEALMLEGAHFPQTALSQATRNELRTEGEWKRLLPWAAGGSLVLAVALLATRWIVDDLRQRKNGRTFQNTEFQLDSLSSDQISQILGEPSMTLFTKLALKFGTPPDVISQLNNVVKTIETDPASAPIQIQEIRFTSRQTSPWPNNNTVHGYVYTPRNVSGPLPGIIIPGYMELDSNARATSLLLAARGFKVMELSLPLYGNRTVPKTEGMKTIERFIALELGPIQFSHFILQATDDLSMAAQWMTHQGGVDSSRCAILGNSMPASIAILAYTSGTSFSHGIFLLPLVNYARVIWEWAHYADYGRYLESVGINPRIFKFKTRSLHLLKASPRRGSDQNALVVFIPTDQVAPEHEVREMATRLGFQNLWSVGSERRDPHLTGLFRAWGELLDRVERLIGGNSWPIFPGPSHPSPAAGAA